MQLELGLVGNPVGASMHDAVEDNDEEEEELVVLGEALRRVGALLSTSDGRPTCVSGWRSSCRWPTRWPCC